MKKTSIYFIIILSIVGCKEDFVRPIKKRIIGEWQWLSSSGGLAGVRYTPQNSEIEIQVRFDSKGNFTEMVNDTLGRSSSYKLIKSDSDTFIEYYSENGSSFLKQYAKIEGDTLTLDDGCCDLFVHIYKRIN